MIWVRDSGEFQITDFEIARFRKKVELKFLRSWSLFCLVRRKKRETYGRVNSWGRVLHSLRPWFRADIFLFSQFSFTSHATDKVKEGLLVVYSGFHLLELEFTHWKFNAKCKARSGHPNTPSVLQEFAKILIIIKIRSGIVGSRKKVVSLKESLVV